MAFSSPDSSRWISSEGHSWDDREAGKYTVAMGHMPTAVPYWTAGCVTTSCPLAVSSTYWKSRDGESTDKTSILPFLVVGHNHLAILLSSSQLSTIPNFFWNFDAICHNSGDISISGFGSHFQLSVIIGIAFELAVVENPMFAVEFWQYL